jgi:hypothetical protein
VEIDVQAVLAFFEDQKRKQVRHFPTVESEKVLTYMATTSHAGTHCAVSLNPIRLLESVDGSREMHVHVRGGLPRPPHPGECITVHVTNAEHYQGYQIKTRTLTGRDPEPPVVEPEPDGVVVKGSHIFTVHHSPYTMKFFEQIPFEEVLQIVGKVPCAMLGVGETANVSPRFVYQWELRDGKLALYHGDGLALKTYMNLKSNRNETRVAIDLDDYTGYSMEGAVEEFQPHQHPEAYEKICRGFAAGNWGRPSRTFRFVAERIRTIAPDGPLR